MELKTANNIIDIKAKGKEIDKFKSYQDWMDRASQKFKNFSLEEKLLTLDKNGSAITIGKDLIYAKDNDLFPITVYVLARSHEYNPEEDKYL